eukprot:gnl/MRDRNA2_/MRDRNA2_78647_c0_seq1.p1 gnl/MRDRNA2_/MRDRNA2_78647_c0~~gnl/MRDRNA2_/MRDRNA2_78647_c0_seq1.p1  ORF type:complete len:142 (-),score=23.89 gnl/MRDRNA2_/MRDRNA2_78647_c0_seq1:259-684(-)
MGSQQISRCSNAVDCDSIKVKGELLFDPIRTLPSRPAELEGGGGVDLVTCTSCAHDRQNEDIHDGHERFVERKEVLYLIAPAHKRRHSSILDDPPTLCGDDAGQPDENPESKSHNDNISHRQEIIQSSTSLRPSQEDWRKI